MWRSLSAARVWGDKGCRPIPRARVLSLASSCHGGTWRKCSAPPSQHWKRHTVKENTRKSPVSLHVREGLRLYNTTRHNTIKAERSWRKEDNGRKEQWRGGKGEECCEQCKCRLIPDNNLTRVAYPLRLRIENHTLLLFSLTYKMNGFFPSNQLARSLFMSKCVWMNGKF